MRERLTRLRALLGLGGQLVLQRLRVTAPRRTVLTVLGVAFAVGLCVTVSGVSVAVADQGTVVGSNVDYWIVPDSASSSTLPVSADGPKFGGVHSVAAELSSRDDVAYASPVSLSLLQLSHGNTTDYVLVAGVVAHPGLSVAGVNASALAPGDPHYGAGGYDGPWTGEAVFSRGAASLLNVTQGDAVTFPEKTGAANSSFTVTAVTDGGSTGAGSIPVAVVHLSELQTLTDGTDSDTADQILVSTNTVGLNDDLAAVYDHSRVVTRSGSGLTSVSNSDLALALAGAGLLISLVIGVLFVATTMGLEVTTDRRLWATLSTVGFSTRSRAMLLALQTGLLTLAGGILGAILGRVGVFAANAGIQSVFGQTTVAVYPIEFVPYALAFAACIGLLTTPYLLWLVTRGSVIDTLTT